MSSGARGDPVQIVDSSGHGYQCTGGHDDVLPPAPQIVDTIWEDVVHDQAREAGEVPGRLLEVVGSGVH